jgi:DMSO/TMAO reductase YedYZ molybdopterin-dependent catalytic subunit
MAEAERGLQAVSDRPSHRRWPNLALLALLPAAVLTGVLANAIGTHWPLHPIAVHGAVAAAILLVAPWKSAIIRHGLRRRLRSRRWWSLTLLLLIVLALGTGLLHATGQVERVGPLTLMQIHVCSAVLALPVAVLHYRMHPVRLRRTDLDRRAFIGAAAITAGAVAALTAWELVLNASRLPGASRRFTGSVERGTGDLGAMPVVSWLDDRVQQIDPDGWRLRVDDDVVLDLDAIRAMPQESITAVLDCTGGWFAEQDWRGVRLDRLIRPDPTRWRSVEVESVTGYARRFPLRDLHRLWLATSVAGESLSAGHGFPARIVAPDRRGFWWVKWVVSIRPSAVPWWLQSPFPLT